ncbi:MAG TPA: hypothetical protein VJ787_01735 [Thermoleophilia bacterium]|nr:hypothetical protein [Thermoleophilia bacterium]
MPQKKLDPGDYLKPRDISTLVARRGRSASTFYPDLVNAFMASGEAAMEVDVAKIGRKPETVRSALAKAIRTIEVREKVRVSRLGDGVFLIVR